MQFAASNKTSASPSQSDENSTDDQPDADDRIGRDGAAEYESRQDETADRGQRQYLPCHPDEPSSEAIRFRRGGARQGPKMQKRLLTSGLFFAEGNPYLVATLATPSALGCRSCARAGIS
jgi:hypothetical protein